MRKIILLMSLAFAICIPKTSFSQNEMTKGSQEWNKLEISNIRNQLRGNAKKLSLLKEDLKVMYTSMDSFHAEERFLIIHCRENIERIEGVYTYVADMLEQYLIMKKDKMPYYSYLEEYGVEQMRRLVTEHLNNIRRMPTRISSKPALRLIDKATGTVCSSSGLLDKAIEMMKQQMNH